MSALDHDITHRPDYAMLRVRLQKGQQVFAEPSAMATTDAAGGRAGPAPSSHSWICWSGTGRARWRQTS